MEENAKSDLAESTQLELITNVTYDELNEFYATMGTEGPCEVCQSVDWAHVGSADGPAPFRLQVFGGTTGFSVAFGMVCNHCGNVRMTDGRSVLRSLHKEAL